eukprot:3225365-Prymnesium_polylepis.2
MPPAVCAASIRYGVAATFHDSELHDDAAVYDTNAVRGLVAPASVADVTAAAVAWNRPSISWNTVFARASRLKNAATNLTHSTRASIPGSEEASNATSIPVCVAAVAHASVKCSCEPLW